MRQIVYREFSVFLLLLDFSGNHAIRANGLPRALSSKHNREQIFFENDYFHPVSETGITENKNETVI